MVIVYFMSVIGAITVIVLLFKLLVWLGEKAIDEIWGD